MLPSTQILLIGGGLAACALALIWRALARHRETSRLNRRLCRADQPIERARAGNEMVTLGLGRSALLVLHAMAGEPDARVRLSVALAVAKRQWEPTGARRVRSVRKWAGEEFEIQERPVTPFGPAVTRLADMGGPRPSETPSGDPKAPEPAPANESPPTEPATVPTPAVTATEPTPQPTPNGATPDREAIRWVAPAANEPSAR
jgi:hypothetical protein